MTITIKDVAARAGVSAKTVSRVMNGEAHVRASVRDAVLDAVAELGYRPNAFARGLSSARSFLLVLLIDDAASGYANAMLRGALDRCRREGYHLVIEPLGPHAPDWDAILHETFGTLRPDGAIVAPPLSQDAALLDRLDGLCTPYVCVSPDGRVPARSGVVDFDEEAATCDITRHLIGLGHDLIGFIRGDPVHHASSLRLAGFQRAMFEAGYAVRPDLIRSGDFSFRAGLDVGEALLRARPRPTAILASNDDMALGVSVAAMKHHIIVPDDLSVAGFDDAPTARLAWPSITTVRQPVEQLGAAAVEMLVDPNYRATYRTGAWWRRMEYELVLRDSSAAHPCLSG